MEISGVGSERAQSLLCGLCPCHYPWPPTWGILLCDPGEPLPSSGPLPREARGQGAPRPSQAVPRGDPISSRAHAQLARSPRRAVVLGAARTLGFILSLTSSEVPFFAGPPCRVCILERTPPPRPPTAASQDTHPPRGPRRGPPSGGHSREHQSADRAPRARGRGQNSGSTPVYWLSARAALRPPPLPGPDSTERNAPRALYCAAAAGSRGRGPPLDRLSVKNYTHADTCNRPILRLPSRGATAPPSPGPPPSWPACDAVCLRRASQVNNTRIWKANRFARARVGAALLGKEKGASLVQGHASLRRRFSWVADSKGCLLTLPGPTLHPHPRRQLSEGRPRPSPHR